MGLFDSLRIKLKPVASTDSADKFETDKREEIDTNTKRFSHYTKDGRLVFYHIETYDTTGRIIHETAYNAAGKQLEGCWFFNDQGFLMKQEDVYDSLNRLIENYRHGSDAHNAVGNRTLYHYVGDTNTIEYTEYYTRCEENGTHNAPVYDYQTLSADGRSRVLKRYNENHVLTRVTDIEMDENGHKVLEVTADADEIVDFYNIFKYDGAGKKQAGLSHKQAGSHKEQAGLLRARPIFTEHSAFYPIFSEPVSISLPERRLNSMIPLSLREM